MNTSLALKLGQICGALLLSVGVASCTMNGPHGSAAWFLGGALVYGGCRLGAWLRG